nr:SAM-dependent methyltransferase [Lachnospiraceae bacterium]
MTENRKKVELSERLSAVAELVSAGGCVADVGCDHGFVSIYLVQNHKTDRVIAMDVNEGPLARAKEHVEAYGLEAYIQLRQSDGLAKVTDADGVSAAVIAGMGGKLMEKIIAEALGRGLVISEYILQPQSDLASFRRFLREHEYTVTEERMICEEGKYYPMMKACYRAAQRPGIDYESDFADAFGPLLLAEKNPVLLRYLQKETVKFEQIAEKMRLAGSVDPSVEEKCNFLKRATVLF